MSKIRLNAAVAIEKAQKATSTPIVTAAHRKHETPVLFAGQIRSYTKRDEEGEDHPAENVRVQCTAAELLGVLRKQYVNVVDVTATKDNGNTQAVADVVVDNETLVSKASVPFLLFLEKQLDYVKTFVEKLPSLDSADSWTWDAESQLHRAAPTTSLRSKKVNKVIVRYPATDKHPAQTDLVTEDVQVGTWTTTKLSGALSAERKRLLLERVDELNRAVIVAREQANDTLVEEVRVGEKIFDWLLKA